MKRITLVLGLCWTVGMGLAAWASPGLVSADVCIYGGTSGGVVAAVQVARMGRTAVLLEPARHLGGMSAAGLSWTDVGSSDRVRAIGGMAREFYERVGKQYGQAPATVFQPLPSLDPARRGNDFAKPPSLSFEPKVAEAVFNAWVAEAKVPVHFQARLASVRKVDGRIVELRTRTELRVQARLFIDASYEGDLMAAAGVSYTCGREANAQYGETCNGVQGPASNPRAGKFEVAVDPYVVAGQPQSGLVPYLVQAGALGQPGAADALLQSYNYRVCLTDQPANRRPIEPPPHYAEQDFELLARWIEARVVAGDVLQLSDFLKYDPLQHGKYDFNNRWAISTDYVGGAQGYPEADAEGREKIARAHEEYLRGFFHFLATSRRVPEPVRRQMNRFGLCRDEFPDNGGWPHQLYVREARRMVSEVVMSELHCTGQQVASNSIGLGTYGMDLHAVRRIAHQGRAVNEGTQSQPVPAPYPIGYGALIPKAVECTNLLVPFALSASHVAFGSIRMEPTFMILSQSAATAACLALDQNTSVQGVDYAQLAARLRKDGQVLGWQKRQ